MAKKKKDTLVYAPSVYSWVVDYEQLDRPDEWHELANELLVKKLGEWYPDARIEIGNEDEYGSMTAAGNWSYFYEIIQLPADYAPEERRTWMDYIMTS